MWYATRHADVAELLADPRFIRPTINEWPEVVGRDPARIKAGRWSR